MKQRMIFRDTRGLSHHIEMIISFSLFVLFVFFVILFVQPQDGEVIDESVLAGLQYNFIESMSTDVVEFSMFVDVVRPQVAETHDCLSITDLPDFFDSGISGINFQRNDGDGFFSEPEGYELDNNELRFSTQFIQDTSATNDYYRDSFRGVISDDLEMGYGTVNPADPTDPTGCIGSADATSWVVNFGGAREREVISYKTLVEEFAVAYESDYENLKRNLGIPSSYDFAITSTVFRVGDDQIPGGGSEVIAQDFVVPVLFHETDVNGFYNVGDINQVRFSILLWQ